jgi:hypothetical protein
VTHRLHETRAQTVGHPGIKALPPAWAEKFRGEFGDYEVQKLPWLKKK